jgi:hypothetical protein
MLTSLLPSFPAAGWQQQAASDQDFVSFAFPIRVVRVDKQGVQAGAPGLNTNLLQAPGVSSNQVL